MAHWVYFNGVICAVPPRAELKQLTGGYCVGPSSYFCRFSQNIRESPMFCDMHARTFWQIRAPLFAARTLNPTGQYRVTLSLR